MKRIGIALVALILASCAETGRGCPTVVEYSDEFTVEFLNQYDLSIPAGSPVDRFIIDAKRLRDEARACRKS